METHSLKLEPLSRESFDWFTNVAAKRMLVEEVKRPELVNLPQICIFSEKVMEEGTAFVVRKGEEYVGALAAMLVPNLYNPSLISLVEMIWYVLPEYRKTRAGYLLLRAFDERAKEVANDSVLTLLTDSEISVSSLAKKGFYCEEMSFRKEYK